MGHLYLALSSNDMLMYEFFLYCNIIFETVVKEYRCISCVSAIQIIKHLVLEIKHSATHRAVVLSRHAVVLSRQALRVIICIALTAMLLASLICYPSNSLESLHLWVLKMQKLPCQHRWRFLTTPLHTQMMTSIIKSNWLTRKIAVKCGGILLVRSCWR